MIVLISEPGTFLSDSEKLLYEESFKAQVHQEFSDVELRFSWYTEATQDSRYVVQGNEVPLDILVDRLNTMRETCLAALRTLQGAS